MSEDYRKIVQRVKTVEEVIPVLTEMLLRTEERMDSFDGALNNLTTKVAALADAQIRTEDTMTRLAEAQARTDEALERMAEAQARTDEALERMAEAQAHTDQRLDALIDIVRSERNGGSSGG